MDTLLILLGILGFGAIIVSVHVISSASGAYDMAEVPVPEASFERSPQHFVERHRHDRRVGRAVVFPLTIGGMFIHEDRRVLPDRRTVAA
jgi:hypothetical protein